MTCKPPEVSLKRRWLLYSGAWGIAFLCCILPDPRSIALLIWFLPFFPIGLIAWFNTSLDSHGRGNRLTFNVPQIDFGLFFSLRSTGLVNFGQE
jgi:hypothetical protein